MSDYRFIGNAEEESSVSINGVRLADLGVHVLAPSQEPLMPEMRNHTLTIPERHGSYDFGAYLGDRKLDIACGFNNQASLGDSQRLVRELAALLLDHYGRPKTVEVVYDYEPDKFYRARLSAGVPLERIVRAGKFVLPMVAYDPYAYSRVTSDEVVWGSEVITFEYNYLLGHTGTGGSVAINSPTTIPIYVDGQAIKPIFEISGSASSFNVSSGDYSFELPSFSGAEWTLDFERYTVTRNGEGVFGEVTMRDFVLEPGDNEVKVAGSGIDVDMRIKFRDKYI